MEDIVENRELDDISLLNELFLRESVAPVVTTMAKFKDLHISEKIKDAVVIFGESHGFFDQITRKRIWSACDLMRKVFDISTCEAYELRTGFLNRYNFLDHRCLEASDSEWEKALQISKKNENDWVDYCKPYLPGFQQKDWSDFVLKEKNVYFEQCRQLVFDEINKNNKLKKAFLLDVENHSQKCSNRVNTMYYLLEEMSVFFSLPIVFSDKKIYFVYPSKSNNVFIQLSQYPTLAKTVTYLTPNFQFDFSFKNEASFLMCRNSCFYTGFSRTTEQELERETRLSSWQTAQ